eukprot:6199688-Pleurochrysis_carterae.AAC.2
MDRGPHAFPYSRAVSSSVHEPPHEKMPTASKPLRQSPVRGAWASKQASLLAGRPSPKSRYLVQTLRLSVLLPGDRES